MSMIGKGSPWGAIDSENVVAEGITFVHTPGHGGYKLSRERNAKVDSAWRKPGGWYEEDCEWAIVALTFPDVFPAEHNGTDLVALTHQTAKNYYPDEYAAATGNTVLVQESYVLRQRAFRAGTEDDLVTISAFGDWAEWVPAGMVGVFAVVGGRGALPTSRVNEQGRYYLVPAAAYRNRPEFGFIVDPAVHAQVPGPDHYRSQS